MENSDQQATLSGGRIRVGQTIRAKRKKQGLSLADLAEKVGAAVSTISKIETGKIGLSFERMEKIGYALGMDYVELLGGSEGPPSARIQTVAAERPSRAGSRRSITEQGQAPVVDAGAYLEWFHAADMLHKMFQPIVAEILIDDVSEYGAFTHHAGEEYNYVLEGELEFHSDTYAPVRLKAGSSIYFDAEMKHAHIRVGTDRCRMLAILCPRTSAEPLSRTETQPTLRITHGQETMAMASPRVRGRR